MQVQGKWLSLPFFISGPIAYILREMADTSTLENIVSIIRTQDSFVLTTHVNPDGDGLGSELALAACLTGMGKEVHILNHSATPAVYRFLDPAGRIQQFREELAHLLTGADVIIVLDTNAPGRIRSLQPYVAASKSIKVCIDHHLDPAPFADHYLIDPEATSTGEMMYRVLTALQGPALSPTMATSLYCAIMTDTGSFRYPRVDPEIHRIVAHLIECGADPVAIFHEVYEQWSPGRIHLLGAMLGNLRTAHDGRLAHACVTRRMLTDTRTLEEDTDNFTTYPMSIEGVQAGIFFLELDNGVKISFRSRGDIPINELAKEFGGNGHKNAAGARIRDVLLPDIRERVVSAAARYLQIPDHTA